MNEEDYQRRIAELEQQLQELNNRYQYLEEQFRIAQQKQFGKSTEGHPGQGELFNEAEELAADVETPEQEAISYTRNKPKRKPLPEDLPREVIVHDIPDEDKVCGCCAGTLHCIGEDKSEKLQFTLSAKSPRSNPVLKVTRRPFRLNALLRHCAYPPMSARTGWPP